MTTKDDNKRDAGRPNESVCQDEWLDDEDSHTHQVKCSLCGTVTNVTPDSYELERCTACGYAARNLATGNESIKEVVASDAYRTQLYDATMSETARYYLCEAMIAVAAGGWEVVLRYMLHNLVSYLREHDRIRSGDTRQERRSMGSRAEVDGVDGGLAAGGARRRLLRAAA
jgi:hypothetical protein